MMDGTGKDKHHMSAVYNLEEKGNSMMILAHPWQLAFSRLSLAVVGYIGFPRSVWNHNTKLENILENRGKCRAIDVLGKF